LIIRRGRYFKKKCPNGIQQHGADRDKPYLIDISKRGWIYHVEEKQIAIDKNDFSVEIPSTRIKFDVVFLAWKYL